MTENDFELQPEHHTDTTNPVNSNDARAMQQT